MDTIEKRLENLGITLPKASNPAASYTNYVLVKYYGFSELRLKWKFMKVYRSDFTLQDHYISFSLRDHLFCIDDGTSIFRNE